MSRLARISKAQDSKLAQGAYCPLSSSSGALCGPISRGAARRTSSAVSRSISSFSSQSRTTRVDQGDPKRHLLSWVRRLEVFGDERALREPPAAVEGIDAVRFMTVHASKGLEFPVVHLPRTRCRHVPQEERRTTVRCRKACCRPRQPTITKKRRSVSSTSPCRVRAIIFRCHARSDTPTRTDPIHPKR